MDNSVKAINDSTATIGPDEDLEDGEVVENDDAEVLNTTAKTKPDTAVAKQSVMNQDEERMIFEAPVDNSTLFLVDTSPTIQLNARQVPSYWRGSTQILDELTPSRKKMRDDAANKCSRPRFKPACFNCGSTEHSLRECGQKRNQTKINRARKRATLRNERYHVDADQRYAHIRPGKISRQTRKALGFNRSEIPFMFYRMRELGYPPAWLEEARVQGSGIALFNADGSEQQAPEELDGETNAFKYDVSKIIDFPGFNMEPAAPFVDDYRHHHVSPFHPCFLKDNFIKTLGNITQAYKRKKLSELPMPHDIDATADETDANLVQHDVDMDDDDNEPEKPMQQPLPAPSPSPPQKMNPKRSASPTLEDLKVHQAQLLDQLKPNTSLNTTDISIVELSVPIGNTETQVAPATPVNGAVSTSSTPVNGAVSTSSTPGTSVESAICKLFNGPSIEGTPILKFSVYDKLPVGDNFKVGVSDVINFENLPDSTGKYEQMKDLLKNVRRKMEQLQQNNDD